MKQPDVRTFLHDVILAGERIRRFIGEMAVEEYCANELVKAAVERQFEIVGEALRNAANARPELRTAITAFPRIVAFRNQLVHGYFGIDAAVVWAVAKDNLPGLLDQVREILEQSGTTDGQQ